MKDLETKERELERDRSDFAKRLTEFNKEVARRGRQREQIEKLEADTKAREAELEELRVVLKALDALLEHLPDDKVAAFSQSEQFKLYEKIMDKYLREVKKW
jgi:septal ring factor EnvC (AmiA/AmiB activator)